VTKPVLQLVRPQTGAEFDELRSLLREYMQTLPSEMCFEDFDFEIANLPGDYAEPRGALVLGKIDQEPAGCCVLRPLDTVDYPNACEMKRLYVRPQARRTGLGRLLAEAILDCARVAGYSCLLLDTLDQMESARAVYQDLGFEEIPPYYHNPIAGAHYLKVML
jgi:putative acetyltransferase